ncbi:MAG: aminopeptidase P family protein [Candidatus Riflebacteria bacterium]|nr:aminopeptidase P family protein [Candidatus Riflebacteria bacterium]
MNKKFDITGIYRERQKRVASLFTDEIAAMWVTHLPNIRYLCGFSGSSGGLLLLREKAIFFTDFRYQEQSEKETGAAVERVIFKTTAGEALLEYLKMHSIQVLGIEGVLSVDAHEVIRRGFSGKITVLKGLPEKVRRVKDLYEIECLRKAFAIADRSYAKLLKFLKTGRREIDIAAKLEYYMRTGGSDGPSFDTIIASGERSSCPHAHPTLRKTAVGEMLKIDFGAVYAGYHSDMTRTVFFGKPDAKFTEIYGIVSEAQRRAIAAIRPGVPCIDIDKIARDHIAAHGHGERFGHSLGHSLGLEIHELPAFSQKSSDTLEEGMVLTVEPGIYLPGWGGIRIEDVYVVRKDGPERLTNTPNDLFAI